MTSKIIGTGSYVPDRIITNHDLSKLVETSDEWISDRTGIKERHISVSTSTAELAAKAARQALDNAGTEPLEIDLIIIATITPDHYTPSTACEVQAAIGAANAFCFDLNAACSGFLYAFQTAHAYIMTGLIKKALIIGAENLSKITDWSDRSTCVLFGDGAGAAVVAASDKGLIKTIAGSDGSKGSYLFCPGASLQNPYTEKEQIPSYLKMDGQEVFKFATRKIPETIQNLLENTDFTIHDLQYILVHQANKRIIQSAAKRLQIEEDMFPMNLDKYGNTSAASLPILLDEVNRAGKLAKEKPVILCGFGGGLTWGGILMVM